LINGEKRKLQPGRAAADVHRGESQKYRKGNFAFSAMRLVR
jgi:hypothetical protein